MSLSLSPTLLLGTIALTLFFVLMSPNKKIRKGAKMTMSEWCDKEGILWYNIETLQELIDHVTNARGN